MRDIIADQIAASNPSPYDSEENCKNVVHFFRVGTASHFEANFLEACCRADKTTLARLALSFPFLVGAFREAYGR